MKRKVIGLIFVCMLLSGCGIGSSQPLQTEAPTAATHLPLLGQGVALEESSNLRYIPNATVEGMVCPEVRLLGNGLLLSEHRDKALVLKHISLEDGALVKENAIPA